MPALVFANNVIHDHDCVPQPASGSCLPARAQQIEWLTSVHWRCRPREVWTPLADVQYRALPRLCGSWNFKSVQLEQKGFQRLQPSTLVSENFEEIPMFFGVDSLIEQIRWP